MHLRRQFTDARKTSLWMEDYLNKLAE